MVIVNMYDSLTIFLIVFGFIFCRSFLSLAFSANRSSFSLYCKAGLVVLNFLNLLVWKAFDFSIKSE